MPATKGKGGSVSHHQPASQYDHATLAQKREYWRIKKREQRARLLERRGNQTQDSQGKKLLHPNFPTVVNSQLSGSFAALSSPLQSDDESYKPAGMCPASYSGNTDGESPVKTTGSKKEKCLETTNLNKIWPPLPAASCSISAKVAGGEAVTVKCLAMGAVSKALTSLTPSETHLNTSSLVPPVRVTRNIKGRFANRMPQPVQGASVHNNQHKAQVTACNQPKLLATNVTAGTILVSPPCVPASVRTEGKASNTSPQIGERNASVVSRRAKEEEESSSKGASSSQPSLLSEEERAARRREHWRIKKREQRAKLAAQIAKARERTQGAGMTPQRQMTRKAGIAILQHPPSQSFLTEGGQKQGPPPVNTSLTSVKKENEVQSIAGQADQIKAVSSDAFSMKKAAYLSNASKGITWCKTPRQRLNDAHKNFMNQRSTRCKSQLLVSIFGTRNIPKIDPNDTPEQIIAKRREYWRIKKREQRAKLSTEVKTRLKEKDSLIRRVKRYQKILEEMRRARMLTQPAGGSLAHASETIGGFIKEDGTVTINIPEVPADHQREEGLRVVPANHVRTAQHQPDAKQRPPAGGNQRPPPRHPAQVKVSLPRSALLSDRSRPQPGSNNTPHSHPPARQAAGQLTLTHPPSTQDAVGEGSAALSPRVCVMKMTVSDHVSGGPASREEERMAKKREYWRIKKREQRAAWAVRLKQGVPQVRADATSQSRRSQRPAAAAVALRPGRRPDQHNAQTPSTNSGSGPAHMSKIKQEGEFMSAAGLHPPPEQAVCPDVRPAASPPPSEPPPESDPTLNADSQATLLAVASMKRLLEESLSTVVECKSEQVDVKIKSVDEASQTDVKPSLTHICPGEDQLLPVAAEQTEGTSLQPEAGAAVLAGSHLRDRSSDTSLPPPSSTEVVWPPPCEPSSRAPSNLIANAMEPTGDPSSPGRTLRLCTRNGGRQNPELPMLHHLPMEQLKPQHCEQQHPNSTSSARKRCTGMTSLQRRREYWKLMKRQQRAKLKSRLTGRLDEGSSSFCRRSINAYDARERSVSSAAEPRAPGRIKVNAVKDLTHPAKRVLKPKPSVAPLIALTSLPTILFVSPAAGNDEWSPDTLQVKLPVTSVCCSSRSEQNKMNAGLSHIESDYLGAPENQQQEMPEEQRWMSRGTDVDLAPCLPTLKPPDNPLSSIDLQPIEPLGQTSNPPLSPVKIPCSQYQSPTHIVEPPTKLSPISTMVPPKPIPGESEEDFLRRKREYWRIKKKEQRARKAIRDQGITSRKACNNWRPLAPAQEVQTQASSQWVGPAEDSEHLMTTSLDSDLGSFPDSYLAPIEDEFELLYADYETSNRDEGPVPDAVWRSRYLMDYDPLNQLLVCMVCGELQYSHSLEGVRAHIDEAHPDTLTMHLRDKQSLLEAWDEQVSQRERFFTSQLQQHGGALADSHRGSVN